jgi:excisionase family DNA binding protein
MTTKDKILDVGEIAKFFGISKKTVWDWCRHGKLPAFKIGHEWKVRQSDLQKLISQKIKQLPEERGLF